MYACIDANIHRSAIDAYTYMNSSIDAYVLGVA